MFYLKLRVRADDGFKFRYTNCGRYADVDVMCSDIVNRVKHGFLMSGDTLMIDYVDDVKEEKNELRQKDETSSRPKDV